MIACICGGILEAGVLSLIVSLSTSAFVLVWNRIKRKKYK